MLDAVIFEGNSPASAVEDMMVTVRHAALADNLDKLLAAPEVDRIFLVTNRPELAELCRDPRLRVEVNNTPPSSFNFGRRLLDLVERFEIRRLLYLGGAAVPLLSASELAAVCRRVLAGENCFVTNNVQSADIVAFTPAAALRQHALPANDNELALLLRYRARLEQVLMPATLGTQFDIDTPADLLVLAASPFGGPRLRCALDSLLLDTSEVERFKQVLRGDYLEVALIGRVGAPVIARLNTHFRVRLRVFSEERGMKALGRLESGQVVSLLGYWLEDIGAEKFFSTLAKTVQGVLMDTRVLFAHLKKELSDADRFWSDLGRADMVSDPWAAEFTRAAARAGLPVLLGGHSLVSGCVWAFTEELGCLI
jgi:hypothetical protein